VKTRIATAVLGLVALLALLGRGPGPGAATSVAPPPPPPRASILQQNGPPPPPAPDPSRNPFLYGGLVEPEEEPVREPRRAPVATPAPTPSPASVRLVGLVGQGGQLRAALAIEGDVLVAAAGEDAGGYHVLSVDPDAGVRLRTPDGVELVLEPPSD
jgi:hypothetical protein